MNVSDQIIRVLDDLCRRFGIVIDWTSQNVFPYLEDLYTRLIAFEIQTSLFYIILAWAICALSWLITWPLSYKSSKLDWDGSYSTTCVAIVMLVVSTVVALAAVIVTGVQIFDIIEAKNIPEKTVIDFISNQMSMVK